MNAPEPSNPTRSAAARPNTAMAADADLDMSEARILVVDDHEQNLELLQAYLEDIGCQILTARDGMEALGIVESSEPDLIVLDVMMPRMSGFQLCSKLKAEPRTRDIPIVMVTALSDVGDVERAVESGADDFLTKPVHKIELVTRVKSLLKYRLLKLRYDQAMKDIRGGFSPRED